MLRDQDRVRTGSLKEPFIIWPESLSAMRPPFDGEANAQSAFLLREMQMAGWERELGERVL